MIEIPRLPFDLTHPRIKILGIGNAGSNAVDRLVLDGAHGVELIAVNTDAQVLAGSVAPGKIQLGQTITRGLGAGGDPDLGRAAAQEAIGEINGTLAGANVVFLVVGLGGGTGSGAAPEIAEAARDHGALTVVVATVPFGFEGKRRLAQAEEALADLRHTADVLLCFENDKMGDAVAPDAPIQEAFAEADRTISQSVRSLVGLAGRKGLIHTGFDEIATAFRGDCNRSIYGCGEATGSNRAHEALEMALRNPLLGRTRLKDDVENVVVSICGGPDLTLNEVQILMSDFHRHVRDRTRVFFGAAIDPAYAGRLSVSILGSFEVSLSASQIEAGALSRNQRINTRHAAPAVPAYEPPAEPELEPELEQYAPAAEETQPEPELEQQPAYLAEPEPEEEHVEEAEPEAPPVARPVYSSVPRAVPPARPLRQPAPAPAASGPKTPPRSPREVRAEQMQLEPINRGRFEKSEPTIIDGQDLDVPTFLRRNLKR